MLFPIKTDFTFPSLLFWCHSFSQDLCYSQQLVPLVAILILLLPCKNLGAMGLQQHLWILWFL